jgi:transcriptional regulator with XRE-family HTH domain
MTFAEVLTRLRERKRLTELEVANRSGISYGTLRGYIMGRRKPPFHAVVKIAAALGTDCRAFAKCDDIEGSK